MGADSSIFDKKSKRFYYFDRDYNFRAGSGHPDANTIVEKLNNQDDDTLEYDTITADEVIRLATLNMVFWEAQGTKDWHRVNWNRSIMAFARAFPDGEFFVVSDHQSPNAWEIEDRGYTAWEPPKGSD